MKKQRLRKVKITKQVVQSGTELSCFTRQTQEDMGAQGKAENLEHMKEPAGSAW